MVRRLTARERLCFDCPLPECNEADPACLYHKAKPAPAGGRPRWEWLRLAVARLSVGQVAEVHLKSAADVRNARSALNPERWGGIGRIKVETHAENWHEEAILYVRRIE